MKQPMNLRQMILRVLTVIVTSALLLGASSQAFAQNDDANRRLSVAVVGFEFNEAAAKEALAAGADINWKNDALNGETLLIQAIKSFKDAKVIKFSSTMARIQILQITRDARLCHGRASTTSTRTATAEKSSRC
jgi:hypothetical protein